MYSCPNRSRSCFERRERRVDRSVSFLKPLTSVYGCIPRQRRVGRGGKKTNLISKTFQDSRIRRVKTNELVSQRRVQSRDGGGMSPERVVNGTEGDSLVLDSEDG